MTVSAQTAKSGPYAGAGSTGPFAFNFSLLSTSHLVATKTSTAGVDSVLTETTDYTVTILTATTGQVTLVAALAVGEKLTLTRTVPKSQDTDLKNLGSTQPEVLEAAYDKLTQIAQDLSLLADLGVRLPVSTSLTELILPSPEAGKSLTWTSTEDGLENTPVVMPSDVTVNSFWETLIEGTATNLAVQQSLDLEPGVDVLAYSANVLYSNVKATLTKAMQHTLYEDPGGTTGTPRTSGTFQLDMDNGMQQRTTIGTTVSQVTIAAPTDFDATTGGYMEVLIEIDTATTPDVALSGFEREIQGTLDLTDNAINLLRISSISGIDIYEIVQPTVVT